MMYAVYIFLLPLKTGPRNFITLQPLTSDSATFYCNHFGTQTQICELVQSI